MQTSCFTESQRQAKLPENLKFLLALVLLTLSFEGFSQVAINSTGLPPDPDAMLDVSAINQGVLIPRILILDRPPAKPGMLIYQIDGIPGYEPGFYYADGHTWNRVGHSANDYWLPAVGPDIRFPYRVALGGFTDAEDHGLNVQNYLSGKAAVRGAEMDPNFGTLYTEGMLGVLEPSLLGVPFNVHDAGVLGIARSSYLSSRGAAVYGWNNMSDAAETYAGIFISDGSSFTNYGVYSQASVGITNYGLEARATGGGTNYALNAFTDNGVTNYAGVFKGRVSVEGHNGSNFAADSLFPQELFSSRVTHKQAWNSYAVFAQSKPQPGWGYGIYAEGGFKGVYGQAEGAGSTSHAIGVEGYATGTAGTRYGVFGRAVNNGGLEAYGVYGMASGAGSNWAGFFAGNTYAEEMRIGGIAKATGYALSVNGGIACEAVLVDLVTNWPDYVFNRDYELMSIPDLEKAIEAQGHLPGLPSARQVHEKGFELADMQKRVVEKVEELTLYTIQQHKMIEQLQMEIKSLKAEINGLRQQNISLSTDNR